MKIKKIYLAISESIKAINLDGENNEVTIQTVNKFMEMFFANIDDPRVKGRCIYPLDKLLTIIFLCIMRGIVFSTQMAFFVQRNKQKFQKLGLIEENVPSHDTFRNILILLDSQTLIDSLLEALTKFFKAIEKNVDCEGYYHQLCLDGKSNRGTGRGKDTINPTANVNVMSVYDMSNGLVISSANVDKKSNEIPVGQELMSKLYLKGTIFTCDSLNTQTKMAKIIHEKRGDYVMTVKKIILC